MKKTIITILISLLVLVSIGGNIYILGGKIKARYIKQGRISTIQTLANTVKQGKEVHLQIEDEIIILVPKTEFVVSDSPQEVPK